MRRRLGLQAIADLRRHAVTHDRRTSDEEPGPPISLTRTTDSVPVRRLLVVGDDRGIVALDLTNPALPKKVVRTLASSAVDHPGALVGVLESNDAFEVDDVHLGPDGLYLRGKAPGKLAERGECRRGA
jgi:hypothetical protein